MKQNFSYRTAEKDPKVIENPVQQSSRDCLSLGTNVDLSMGVDHGKQLVRDNTDHTDLEELRLSELMPYQNDHAQLEKRELSSQSFPFD